MSAVSRVPLSDEVREAIDEEPDANRAFALLTAAADFSEREHRPMTLEEALRIVRQVADGIEALG